MDFFTMKELEPLLEGNKEWLVSLYMPTHRGGPQTQQDPIRWKNLLRTAEERLEKKGMRPADIKECFQQAWQFHQDSLFWQNQSDGLAAFLGSGESSFYRLPVSFEELAVVSDRFHLKPLLPYFARDGRFYILALSQKQVRLFEGTRYGVEEVNLEDMPQSVAEALNLDDVRGHLQYHTGTSSAGGERAAMYHGHNPQDDEKDQIQKWFHQIDRELSGILRGGKAPLILAGVEYLFHLYKEANTYPHLVEGGVTGNPEDLSAESLHEKAWPLVEPIFGEDMRKAKEKYFNLTGTKQITNDISEALRAAEHGRVESLFIPKNRQIWGRYDRESDSIEIAKDHPAGSQDLLDLVAAKTMRNGGDVYAVEQDEMPGGEWLAAVLRY
ncbi:MAG: hypothetical protein GX791_08915 [Synergistaceae bacterium]|nr:hypothetical protein [Synergistaceae bacterium]